MNGDPSTESHLRIPVLPVELLPLDENAIAQVDGDGVLASLGMDAQQSTAFWFQMEIEEVGSDITTGQWGKRIHRVRD